MTVLNTLQKTLLRNLKDQSFYSTRIQVTKEFMGNAEPFKGCVVSDKCLLSQTNKNISELFRQMSDKEVKQVQDVFKKSKF